MAGAKAFQLMITVENSDIDQLGHVNNVKYLQWVQEVAVAHWRAVASPEDQQKLLWVVLRHEIDYNQPVFAGEALRIRTWVGNATKLKFERHTEFVRQGDSKVVAKALTVWCPIDAKTSRPVAVNAALREAFSDSDGAAL
jgi:acyl-CoA thioester hydrolase